MEIGKINTDFVYDHNCVVHVRSYDEAKELTTAVREQFPDFGDYNDPVESICRCWSHHGTKTCLRFNHDYGGVIRWGYCHYGYYVEEGKHIIEFNELLNVVDYGEIKHENNDLDAAIAALF